MSLNNHPVDNTEKSGLQLNYLWPNLLTTGGLFAVLCDSVGHE